MLKNYLITALRNLRRERSSTLINVAGLTLGISGSLILSLLVAYHLSFDQQHAKRDRIYRVVLQSDGNAGKDYQAGVPAVLPDAFRADFPEAEQVMFASYRSGEMVVIPQPNQPPLRFQEAKGVVFVEPSFFRIFDRAVLQGDAVKGLDEPGEAVISRSLAKKYFKTEDALGQILKIENTEYKITAVVEDAPYNTDLPFDLFLSYITVKKAREEAGWGSIWSDEQCYFLLKEGEDVQRIESRLPDFYKKYNGEHNPDNTEAHTQPLSMLHFDDRFDNYSYNTVPKGMLVAFAIIALVLVTTACINFINLSTAEAIKRSKEVGVRKSLGSTRGQLIGQFLGETTLVTLVSVLLAVGLSQLALGFLNAFLDLHLSIDPVGQPWLILFLLGITVVVSLLSGLYPSMVLSGFRPAQALKNQINSKHTSGYSLRRTLVVLQFCISQFFIIGTIVVIQQVNYFQRKSLGFAQEAIIHVSIPEGESAGNAQAGGSRMRTLRNEMLRVPGVQLASLSNHPPASGSVSATNFKLQGTTQDYGTQIKAADAYYVDLYQLKLVAGQNLVDLDTATGCLVNEKLARVTGFANPADIIGKEIRMWGKQLPVVGVVKDFHTMSLHQPIEATVLLNRLRNYRTLSLKIDMSKSQDVIAALKQKWEATYPEHIFDYQFLDQDIAGFYEGERKMSTLFTIFTSMAIFIGCLGLFGLATFMANQKTKEIGIRKVLGASVESILFIFSKEFLMLIVLGFVLAVPVSWVVMKQFLNEFAYKIDLSPWIFVSGLGITVVIALFTVGYKSIRAAITNPVTALRYE